MPEHGRVRTVPTTIRLALVGGLAGAVLLIGLIALDSGPWQDRPPPSQELPDIEPPEYDLPDAPEIEPPDVAEIDPASQWDASWLKWVLIALGSLVLIALLVYWFKAWRTRPVDNKKHESESQQQASRAPDPIVAQIPDAGFDPRMAADDVISAWQQVEDAATRTGIPRLPQHTATEFLAALGGRVPIHPEAAQTLLAAYQRARFDHTALTPEQVSIAVTCARTVVRDLPGIHAHLPSFGGESR